MAPNTWHILEAVRLRLPVRGNTDVPNSQPSTMTPLRWDFQGTQVWMSHSDTIQTLPTGGVCLASTDDVNNAAYRIDGETTYAIQFHPEVYHTTDGKQLLENFLVSIAGVVQDWTPSSFAEMTIAALQNQIGEDRVVLGLSGGVDSTVAAMLLHKAIGSQLHCIFVNNGLLQKNEFTDVLKQYEGLGLNVKGVDASDRFLGHLAGVSDPEEKRKRIGKVFIDVFDDEATALTNITWLAQGTIYPDVIESVSVNGPSATIKSHHNVGGLPSYMKLKVVEPLRMLFKDEVRRVGKTLGLSASLLGRHPFPGPGLAIRILGYHSRKSTDAPRSRCDIYRWIKGRRAIRPSVASRCDIATCAKRRVMGDERTYEKCVALRAVESTDGMTADWVNLPYPFCKISPTKSSIELKELIE